MVGAAFEAAIAFLRQCDPDSLKGINKVLLHENNTYTYYTLVGCSFLWSSRTMLL